MTHETQADLDQLVAKAKGLAGEYAVAYVQEARPKDPSQTAKTARAAHLFFTEVGWDLIKAIEVLRELNPGGHVFCLECGYSAAVNMPSDPEELSKKTVEAVMKARVLDGDLKYLMTHVEVAINAHKDLEKVPLASALAPQRIRLRETVDYLAKIVKDIEEDNHRPLAPLMTNPFD